MFIKVNTKQDLTTAGEAELGQVYMVLGGSSPLFFTDAGFICLNSGMTVVLSETRALVHKPNAELLTEGADR